MRIRLSIFRFAFPLLLMMFSLSFLSVKDAQACACCGTYKVVRVADWDVLNVRTGPGVSFQVIHSLAPGEGCIIKTGERRGRWVRIQHAGVAGWVNSRYLAIIR